MPPRPTPMVVDINHWLTDCGESPTKPAQLRANALRVLAFIDDRPAVFAARRFAEVARISHGKFDQGLLPLSAGRCMENA